jgi:hypothetical protein
LRRSIRKGINKGAIGRPTVNSLFKRNQCRWNYRLPQWIINWLKIQKESSGRIIERALRVHYRLQEPLDEDEKKEEQD